MSIGRVALVGAGPGDPGLLTLRGAECLAEADVVLHDSLVDPRILRGARPGAEIVSVGKRGDADRRNVEQEAIHRRMVEAALAGKVVVRLKGGDPFLFGRGGEEAEVLADAGIPFEIVPGVSSALAVPAYAGIPVTHRGLASSVAIVTGHEAPHSASGVDWPALARVHTLVVLMARKRLAEVVERLIGAGRDADTPTALIHRGTTGRQKVIVSSLRDLPQRADQAEIGTPSLLIVGEVVRLRERLAWFEARPLLGRRIVVTRPREQSAELIAHLERLGAEALDAPAIAIDPIVPAETLDLAIAELETFDWIVFTSRNGVRLFFERLSASGRDLRALGRARLAAIGPATGQELATRGFRPDFVPEDYVAERLAEGLASQVAGRRVLLARAAIARDVLPTTLIAAGATVVDAPLYRSTPVTALPSSVLEGFRSGLIDAVTFTSSSTADAFVPMLDEAARSGFERSVVASIGPITSAALRRLGVEPTVEASRYDARGLADALVDSLGGRR